MRKNRGYLFRVCYIMAVSHITWIWCKFKVRPGSGEALQWKTGSLQECSLEIVNFGQAEGRCSGSEHLLWLVRGAYWAFSGSELEKEANIRKAGSYWPSPDYFGLVASELVSQNSIVK